MLKNKLFDISISNGLSRRIINLGSRKLISTSSNYKPVMVTSNLFQTNNENISTFDQDKLFMNLQYVSPDTKDSTLFSTIIKDNNLKDNIKNIYFKYGLSICFSLGVSSLLAFLFFPINPLIRIFGWLSSINIGIFSASKISNLDEHQNYKIKNNNKFWYKIFSTSNGIMLSPLVYGLKEINTMYIPIVFGASFGMFAIATLFSLRQNNTNMIKHHDQLLNYLNSFIVSNFLLLVLQILSLSQNPYYKGLDLFLTVSSIVLFTLLIATDTQKIIQDYYNKKMNIIKASLQFVIGFINLLISFIKIISQLK